MPKNNYWRSSESALMRWHVVDDDEGSNEILHIAYRLQDKTTVIWLLGRNQLQILKKLFPKIDIFFQKE
jgi:hypothetical protein